MIDIAQGLLCDHIVSCNVQTELKQTFVSPQTAVSPFSQQLKYKPNIGTNNNNDDCHLPPMFLNHTTHTFSRPGITNYSHTYMTSEYFPGGMDSMCIFLSFI